MNGLNYSRKHSNLLVGEIVNEFLLSTGYLEGAHTPDCPIYQKILEKDPAWRKQAGNQ